VDAVLPLDPATLPRLPMGPPEWLDAWRTADDVVIEVLGAELSTNDISEPLVVARTAVSLTEQDALFVASSMPVRDLEAYAVTRHGPPRVLANRGANGIDGLVSTALGVAAATRGRTVLLIGDVALAHDIGGLLAARRLGIDLTIVLINNDGGGIFHFLPVVEQGDAFEEHVATPHGLDFSHAARLYGLEHRLAHDMPAFDDALAAGPGIVEVRTERRANRELHARVAEAVRRAL
jgi:2-succinyl-5-enolpyruvyl-6-hydroxy-3-cyclohexene-1-carboxylate synthase